MKKKKVLFYIILILALALAGIATGFLGIMVYQKAEKSLAGKSDISLPKIDLSSPDKCVKSYIALKKFLLEKFYEEKVKSFANLLTEDNLQHLRETQRIVDYRKEIIEVKNESKTRSIVLVREHSVDKEEEKDLRTKYVTEKEGDLWRLSSQFVTCRICKGTGKCSYCKGSGKCSLCGGKGRIINSLCSICDGTGICPYCKGGGKCKFCQDCWLRFSF